jgi:hypothetical protein
MLLEHQDRWPPLNPPRKLQNESFWHRRQIWLGYEQQSENSILVLMCPESEQTLIIRVIEYFLIFLKVNCMPRYNKRFRSYEILKSTGLLKLHSGQNWLSWDIWTFAPTSNVISGNLQYQLRSYLSKLSDGYLYASIQLTIEELWSLEVVCGCWNFWFEPKDVTSWLRNLGVIQARSRETLNIEVVWNSISFLKRGETQNFDTKWRDHEALRWEGFSRYDLG